MIVLLKGSEKPLTIIFNSYDKETNTSRGYSLREEQTPKDTRGTFTAKKIGLQDLLYAARPLGDFAMWAHGLQVMRRKTCEAKEMPFL